ncbi:MAG: GGDEF domain-containing protein [Actinomycetota bacterium]|nr:GGDEF domain-containing protein [Actinomycetota bacterium]
MSRPVFDASEPATPLDFRSAAQLVLSYLNANLPLALWSVTRVENGRQTFLILNEENGYAKVRGDSHAWEDSFCIHMAAGRAPAIATDAQAVPTYAMAGVNETTRIGTYAGAVIREPSGELFGAICGLDPDRHVDDVALASAGPLLQMFGELLTLALANDRVHDQLAVELSSARVASETDALTGLANRRFWDRAIADEEIRFSRHADPTVAVMMDLDRLKHINDTHGHAAGDDYIKASAGALRDCVKDHDVVARLGGDEFGILLRGCTTVLAAEVVDRIQQRLDTVGVSGSLGWSPVTLLRGFPDALAYAEEQMYAMKASRRVERA